MSRPVHARAVRRGLVRRALVTLGLLVTAVAAGSCVDPVHDAQIKALGPEVAGVPQGEYHRAGQPCATCHEDTGPAKTVFSVAGTIFYGRERQIGAGNVQVLMVDSNGTIPPKTFTNCVGNFFLTKDQWDPAFPIYVDIQQGTTTARMNSQISRESSCAGCHHDPPNYDTPGHIRLAESDALVKIPTGCPVSPQLLAPGETAAASTGGK